MSSVLLVNTRPTRDYTTLDQDPRVLRYFDALEKRGPKLGDTRTEPNNGLLILGNVLGHQGHRVRYLDVNVIENKHFLETGRFFTFEEMLGCMAEAAREFDFIFVSAIVVGIDDALRAIDALKVMYPDKVMVLGGTFPSLVPGYCLEQCRGLDALLIGEGEELTPLLVEAYATGDFSLLDEAQGLVFRREPGAPLERRQGFNIVDLEPLGPLAFPDWSLLDPDLGPHVYRISTARGCGFKCSYCVPSHMCGHHVRYHDVDHVLAAIASVKEKHHGANYVMGDLTFMYNQKRDAGLLRRLAEMNVGIPFWCQTHLSRVKPENLELLQAAGCSQMAVGVESINPSIIHNINKGTTPHQVIEKLLLIKRYGIETQAYFIIGIPGDTAETIALNKEFIKYGVESGYIDRTHIGIYVPYPGPTAHDEMDITSRDYRHYTQGIFRDMPTRAVFRSDEMDEAQMNEAFKDCLGAVGASLEKRRRGELDFAGEEHITRVVQGAEALYLFQRLRKRARGGKKTVFNLVQSLRPGAATAVSDVIQEERDYVLGSAEAAGEADALALLAQADGQVDTILLDCDVKTPWSRSFLRRARGLVSRSGLISYQDLQCWARCVTQILRVQLQVPLVDAALLIHPANRLGRRIAEALADSGAEVSLTDELPRPESGFRYHALVSAGLEGAALPARAAELLLEGGVLIDGGIGTVDEALLLAAEARGVRVFRPDMRKFVAAELFLGAEFERFVETTVGRRRMHGLPLVSGGVCVPRGHVVVDHIGEPTRILGISDGRGGLVPRNQLTAELRDLMIRANDLLTSASAD